MSDALDESVGDVSLDDQIAAELAQLEPEDSGEASEEVSAEPSEPTAEVTEEPTEEPSEPVEEEKLTPYDHWKAEYKETFNGMSRAQQEAWIAREREFDQGIQAKGQELGQAKRFVAELHSIIEPIANDWARQGLQPAAGIRRAIALKQALRDDPQKALLQLAQERGVDLQQTWAEQPYVDPKVQQLERQLTEQRRQQEEWLAQQEAQREQYAQQQRQQAEQQILTMAEAKSESGELLYPHMQHVMGNMAQILNNGHANSLESAYHLAVQELRNHPVLRDVLQSQTKATAESRKQEADKAKAASRAVESNTTGATSTPKSLDQDILEALEANGI